MQPQNTSVVRNQCALMLLAALLHLPVGAATPTSSLRDPTKTIPWAEVGATAGAQYSGDGLSVTATRAGALLRCVFQRMEGEATREGLWLSSTGTNQANDRFRVTAMAVARAGSPLHADGHAVTRSTQLPATGNVSVDGQTVRFIRPGLVEEYSVSMDGVRQDFLVLERPGGASVLASRLVSSLAPPVDDSELRVELAVTGAIVEPIPGGARLILENSGRKIAYSRLKVTDATGRQLTARMEVGRAGSPLPAAMKDDGAHGVTRPTLAVLVDDAEAVYPVRIDPTFSDANWISMGGGIHGADRQVFSAVADDSGNLYIAGWFTVVGDVIANGIAKWNGSSWSALGSGIEGPDVPAYDWLGVYGLVVSGSNLYAGGLFTIAGGVAATNIAKWDGSSWSPVGSGIDGPVGRLALSGNDVYAGGRFTNAGGVPANNIAKWNGSSWSALGSGI